MPARQIVCPLAHEVALQVVQAQAVLFVQSREAAIAQPGDQRARLQRADAPQRLQHRRGNRHVLREDGEVEVTVAIFLQRVDARLDGGEHVRIGIAGKLTLNLFDVGAAQSYAGIWVTL